MSILSSDIIVHMPFWQPYTTTRLHMIYSLFTAVRLAFNIRNSQVEKVARLRVSVHSTIHTCISPRAAVVLRVSSIQYGPPLLLVDPTSHLAPPFEQAMQRQCKAYLGPERKSYCLIFLPVVSPPKARSLVSSLPWPVPPMFVCLG